MQVWKMLAAAAAALALVTTASAQGRPAAVGTDVVELRAISETVPVFGAVVAGRESAVAARVGGVVADVMVRVGDPVAAGTPIVRLDTERLQISLRAAEANLALAEAGLRVAEAGLGQAQRQFDRAEPLRQRAAISEQQYEDTVSALASAEGAMAEAEARHLAAKTAVDSAEYDVRNAEIKAPFDGILLSVDTEVGQFITIGAPVADLLDTAGLEVEANVPASYVATLDVGEEIRARTASGAPLLLAVRTVLPIERDDTRTRPVRFVAVGDGARPQAVGQSLTLDIPTGDPREVLSVPKDAVVQAQGGWSVFVHEDGKAVPRQVELGATLGDRFEVLSGLASGDEVVVRGNERLRPMQDIQPMRAEPVGQAQNGQRQALNSN